MGCHDLRQLLKFAMADSIKSPKALNFLETSQLIIMQDDAEAIDKDLCGQELRL